MESLQITAQYVWNLSEKLLTSLQQTIHNGVIEKAHKQFTKDIPMRIDGRKNDELRAVDIQRGPMEYAAGCVIISTGNTKVLCSASIDERVPGFLSGSGQGWITAEYSMLPGSTIPRTSRENRRRGRSQEIQRLIGRSLRAGADLSKLGERTVTIDCDVLQADGGTRTASITGGYVALHFAIQELVVKGVLPNTLMLKNVAATSIGTSGDQVLLDLCYEEDATAGADFNVVMAEGGEFIEIQGGAEQSTFDRATLEKVLDLGEIGIEKLFTLQNKKPNNESIDDTLIDIANYAVMALIDLARFDSINPVSLRDISLRQGISLDYLEQIFSKLRKKEIVQSVRGTQGGYILNRKAKEIKLTNIFDAVDEKVKTVQCKKESKKGCNGKSTKCLTHNLWDELETHINNFFDKKSLDDLVKENLERRL